MKQLKIGLIDLDTSHPAAFIPIIRKLGHEVTIVFDGGSVHPESYAEQFAQKHGIPHAATSLEQVVDYVDAVFIHSCNWDLHVERAAPFVEAGKAIFIDKPFAGNLKDLQQFVEWSKAGARITGGSALRMCREVQQWHSEGIAQEDWVYAMAGCAVDEFNYGIHAFAMLHGIMGAGISQVRHIGAAGGQKQVELQWLDGRRAMLSVGHTEGYLPFYANIVTQKRVDFIEIDNSKLYQAMLEHVLPYLSGTAAAPISMEQLVEVEMAAIAAALSAELEGKTIFLSSIPADYAGYNGAEFAKKYQKSIYQRG